MVMKLLELWNGKACRRLGEAVVARRSTHYVAGDATLKLLTYGELVSALKKSNIID